MSEKFGEPWVTTSQFPIYDKSGLSITLSYTNRERIVSCVNALAGIEDPEALILAHKDLVRYVNELADAVDNAEKDIGGARTQIDILRDAVKVAAICEAAEGRKGSK